VAHICNHCEDFEKPVTLENGISLKYPIYGSASELQIDLYLHHRCAEAWSRDFDIPLPSLAVPAQVHSHEPSAIAKSV
jgi:hypothetical protein